MATVYVVQRPTQNKFGWTPDLSDAAKYGELEIIFEPSEQPQFSPAPAIHKAKKILKDFSEDDYLLWAGGGDPTAVMIACMAASQVSPKVSILRWERNFDTHRDRRKGWYMPCTLEMRS
ncbi:MAG: hypothetical protein CML19_08105 [Pusillimonas sp.]|jgi:hypothetical protein|nr:hypothetical protein [Parvibaculum sp.]MBC42175.1 hypothetical protein [Pusillimonas sp.]|tara:strand:+ start:1150 stop:1506 length:357 start_codon:yes stop_codon:yes gene_type:complete